MHSLDQLKDKLAKVIIMVLVVNFFQRVLQMKFATPVDMAFLAGSILALCVGLYFYTKVVINKDYLFDIIVFVFKE